MKEKIDAQIAQNETDQKRLQEEGERLLEKLEKLNKPKLRHGDYGLDWGGYSCMAAFDFNDGMRDIGPDYIHSMGSYGSPPFHVKTKLGNIFDDLKRNKEDLKRFKVDSTHSNGEFSHSIECIATHGNKSANIFHDDEKRGGTYELPDLIEIHQKLGQIIQTIRREQSND